MDAVPCFISPLLKEKTPEMEEAELAKFGFISPLLKEKTLETKEAAPEKREFIWPPAQEEEAIITKVLYAPSNKKRLPVFVSICPK
jgi:hypothetical protein